MAAASVDEFFMGFDSIAQSRIALENKCGTPIEEVHRVDVSPRYAMPYAACHNSQ